jgi:hypothetical protein
MSVPTLAVHFDSLRRDWPMSFLRIMIWMRRGLRWEWLCPRLGNGWEKIEANIA